MTEPDSPQHALHVTDYYCVTALAQLRAIGACGRQARKFTDEEFDRNQDAIEQGDTEIFG